MTKASPLMPRFAIALAVSAVMGLAAAPAAFGAGKVTELFPGGGSLSFAAAEGKANQVTVTASPTSVTISDAADTIEETLTNCTGNGTNTVVCTPEGEGFFSLSLELDKFTADSNKDTLNASGSIRISAYAGEGDDVLTASGIGRFEFSGEDGNDLLTGGAGPDSLIGGEGVDILNSGAGHDALQGGGGAGDILNAGDDSDLLLGTTGDGAGDQLNGGSGLDNLLFLAFVSEGAPPVTADLNAGVLSGGGESDSLSSIEDVVTFQGADTVTGTTGANRIITALDEEPIFGSIGGLGGEVPADLGDTVNPLGGPDLVRTGDGNDTANLVDGYSDQLDCGPGSDSVQADQLDELINCETVTRTMVTPFGSDTTKPSCKLKGVAAGYSRNKFLAGPRATVTCDELVSLEARLTIAAPKGGKGKGARKSALATISRVGDLVVAETSFSEANSATLRLRPTARLLPKTGAFRARLRIVARDKAGNPTVIERSIQVKPPTKKGKKGKKGK